MFLFGKKKVVLSKDITEKNLNGITDFTLLSPIVTTKELEKFICIAIKNKFYCVCVNPCNVAYIKQYASVKTKQEIKVATVIGFPLGQNTLQSKIFEAKMAIADGADELEVVVNIAKIKEGNYKYMVAELSRIVRISRGRIVKAIIETAYLTKTEIEKVASACVKSKVDYIMTSTGYADGGATPEIVEIIKKVVGNKCGIKASGGITTMVGAMDLVRIGANRIGTSRNLYERN